VEESPAGSGSAWFKACNVTVKMAGAGRRQRPARSSRRRLAGSNVRDPVEDGVCLVKLSLMNKILAVSDEQIGIVRGGGEEMEVEQVRAGEVAGIGKDGSHMRAMAVSPGWASWSFWRTGRASALS